MLRQGGLKIAYLSTVEVDKLTETFQSWYDNAKTNGRRKARGRYWLTYLLLRYTGARLTEILRVDDQVDINIRSSEIRLVTLKRRKSAPKRIVPVPPGICAEVAGYLMEFPSMRGKIFKLDQGNFRRVFYDRARAAGVLKETYREDGKKEIFPHPHTLRHTRAMELLANGVPVTAVQDLLGHSSLLTTAEYLRLSGQDIKGILRAKGMI
nr:site-specific integrase [Desulfovulcanus ferrireducens]